MTLDRAATQLFYLIDFDRSGTVDGHEFEEVLKLIPVTTVGREHIVNLKNSMGVTNNWMSLSEMLDNLKVAATNNDQEVMHALHKCSEEIIKLRKPPAIPTPGNL